MKIIDSSVRLELKNGKFDLQSVLKNMKDYGITHSLIAPPDKFTAVLNKEANAKIAKIVSNNPSSFSGLAVANPWYEKEAEENLEQAFKAGLSGLYINSVRQGFRLTEAILNPLLEICSAYKRSVFCHTGTPIMAMPFQLAVLARAFPQIKFVMGHAGYSDFWYDVIPAAKQSDNIFIDITCTTGAAVKNYIKQLGAEHLLWGSAYPRSGYKVELEKILRLDLSADDLEKIMYKNAKELWDIVI